MPKNQLIIGIGDVHAGSTYAVRPRPENQRQEALLERWNKASAHIKNLAKGRSLTLLVGGDVIEGQQGRTAQSRGNQGEQVDWAVELLRPLVNVADTAFGVTGTSAHAGDDGNGDAAVYKELGIAWAHGAALVEVGRYVIDWAHHGVHVPQNKRNEMNGLIERVKKVLDFGDPRTTHVLRHHAHRSPPPVCVNGVWAVVCPCWQLSTDFAKKVADGMPPSIGWVYIDGFGAWQRELYSVDFARKVFKV